MPRSQDTTHTGEVTNPLFRGRVAPQEAAARPGAASAYVLPEDEYEAAEGEYAVPGDVLRDADNTVHVPQLPRTQGESFGFDGGPELREESSADGDLTQRFDIHLPKAPAKIGNCSARLCESTGVELTKLTSICGRHQPIEKYLCANCVKRVRLAGVLVEEAGNALYSVVVKKTPRPAREKAEASAESEERVQYQCVDHGGQLFTPGVRGARAPMAEPLTYEEVCTENNPAYCTACERQGRYKVSVEQFAGMDVDCSEAYDVEHDVLPHAREANQIAEHIKGVRIKKGQSRRKMMIIILAALGVIGGAAGTVAALLSRSETKDAVFCAGTNETEFAAAFNQTMSQFYDLVAPENRNLLTWQGMQQAITVVETVAKICGSLMGTAASILALRNATSNALQKNRGCLSQGLIDPLAENITTHCLTELPETTTTTRRPTTTTRRPTTTTRRPTTTTSADTTSTTTTATDAGTMTALTTLKPTTTKTGTTSGTTTTTTGTTTTTSGTTTTTSGTTSTTLGTTTTTTPTTTTTSTTTTTTPTTTTTTSTTTETATRVTGRPRREVESFSSTKAGNIAFQSFALRASDSNEFIFNWINHNAVSDSWSDYAKSWTTWATSFGTQAGGLPVSPELAAELSKEMTFTINGLLNEQAHRLPASQFMDKLTGAVTNKLILFKSTGWSKELDKTIMIPESALYQQLLVNNLKGTKMLAMNVLRNTRGWASGVQPYGGFQVEGYGIGTSSKQGVKTSLFVLLQRLIPQVLANRFGE